VCVRFRVYVRVRDCAVVAKERELHFNTCESLLQQLGCTGTGCKVKHSSVLSSPCAASWKHTKHVTNESNTRTNLVPVHLHVLGRKINRHQWDLRALCTLQHWRFLCFCRFVGRLALADRSVGHGRYRWSVRFHLRTVDIEGRFKELRLISTVGSVHNTQKLVDIDHVGQF